MPPKWTIEVALEARASDLEAWLHRSPHPLANKWRQTPYPLIRSCELNRPDLFRKWLDWGCSLHGSVGSYKNSTTMNLLDVLSLIRPEIMFWMAPTHPEYVLPFAQCLLSGVPGRSQNIDWSPLWTKSMIDRDKLAELATLMLLSKAPSDGLESLLAHNGGALGKAVATTSPYGGGYASSSYYGDRSYTWVDDVALTERVNKIESGLIQDVDLAFFAKHNYFTAVAMLGAHLALNNPGNIQEKTIIRPNNWMSWAKSIRADHSFGLKTNLLSKMDVWSDLVEMGLDMRHIDRRKNNAFHFLCALSDVIPEEKLQKWAKAVWDKRAELVYYKNNEGHSVAGGGLEDPNKLSRVIVAWTEKNHMQRVLKTQVGGVKKRRGPDPAQPAPDEPVVTKRRRM